MSPDDNRVLPARDRPGDALQDDGLTEDRAAEDIADRAVRALPHLLQLELLNTSLVGGNGGTLDSDLVLDDSLGGIDGHLVVGLRKIL